MKQQAIFNICYFSFLLLPILFISSCGITSIEEKIYENSTRSGPIYSDEKWKGIIDVTGDVDIYEGTLTIEPGTTVRFASGADDRKGGSSTPNSDPYFPHDPAIAPSQISSITVYNGTLYAVGTSEKRIIFISSSSSPKPGDWDTIQINRADGKMTIQYSTLEYGYSGPSINTAVDDAHVVVKNNIIGNVVTAGINCGNSSSTTNVSIAISGNDISYCGHEGIATYPGNNLIIENNIIHDIKNEVDGGGAGVVIEKNNSTVRNNQFLRNRVGILNLDASSKPVISGNTFENNETDISGI